jgi:hypothetical protein
MSAHRGEQHPPNLVLGEQALQQAPRVPACPTLHHEQRERRLDDVSGAHGITTYTVRTSAPMAGGRG